MKPIVLCILDGVGIREEVKGNAVKQATMPTFKMLLNKYPNSLLQASEEAVGLPKNQMGNSEVGHSNIGAGRIVYQPLEIINNSIKDNTIFSNKEILKVINHTLESNTKLHIFGLLSDGGVHSEITHLFSILDVCKKNNVKNLYIHIFLDGRDTLPSKGIEYIEMLEQKLNEIQLGEIATISGRYYAMDRDSNYERIKKAYDVMTKKTLEIKDYKQHIKSNYVNNVTDEFIMPFQVNSEGIIENNDGMIVYNYRPDRLRELFGALTHPEFNKFEVIKFSNIKLVTMFPVTDEIVATSSFSHPLLINTLGEYISNKNLKQLRIAETEKYAHVTYFFDGGKELELKNSNKILIPSPKVATYDLLPSMSANEITDVLLKEIDKYDVVILNYANGDMVGHTGNIEATIKALECLDNCLKRLYEKVMQLKGVLIVTADHGNSDYMLDENNNPITSHSLSKVPFIVTKKNIKLKNGKLSDIAPTILELLKLKKPKEMTGKSLINKKKQNIFMIVSLLIMFSLFITYAIRFVHYYKVEHPNTVNDNSLATKVIDNNEIVVKKSGLYIDNKDYVFKGNVDNNYVSYSGYLFRIVNINSDKSIKIVTNDIVTSLVWGYETDYNNSYVKKYLEKEFFANLNNPDNYIVDSSWCIDEIDKDTAICKTKTTSKVGLLTYNEYKKALANNSYLNIKKYWWTINTYKNNKVWYVFNEGGVNNNSNDSSTYYSYGVRPVVNIKADVNYVSGDGTLENPYTIEEKNNEVSVGKYINYSNILWKVISVNDSIKLVSNDCLMSNGVCLEKQYSASTPDFNKAVYNSIANYLNNTFYNSLDKTHIVNGTWYIGSYNNETNYNYENIYSNSVVLKVGLLNILENNKNTYTINLVNEDLINILQENGMLYSGDITEKLYIYPSINIDKNIIIKSGTGDIENPFIIE